MKLGQALLILASSLALQAKDQNGDERSTPVQGISVLTDDRPDVKALQEGLMASLGLSSHPDLSKLNTSQEAVLKVYSEYWSSPGEKIPIGEPRLWTVEASVAPKRHSGSKDSLIATFDLEKKAETEGMDISLWLARLAHLKLEVESEKGKRGYLTLYDKTNSSKEHLETKWIDNGSQGFDVTVPVSRHLETAVRKIVFYIRCRRCRILSSTLEVLLISEERGLKRWKRDLAGIMDCRTDRRQPKCCRTKMTVSIKKIPQLNYIIHPLEFEAYRCEGRCPRQYRPAHNHALVQDYVHQEDKKVDKHPVTPKPCCAPKTLKDLEIMYVDDKHTFRSGTWKNVIVEECACS